MLHRTIQVQLVKNASSKKKCQRKRKTLNQSIAMTKRYLPLNKSESNNYGEHCGQYVSI